MKKSAFFIPVILATILLLTACGAQTNNVVVATPTSGADTFVAEGHLVPRDKIYQAFPVGGTVEAILVKKGDTVTQGQVLVRLGDRQQAQAALAVAQLAQTSAQQAYDTLVRTADLGRAQAWQAYMEAQKTRAAAQLAWDRLDPTAIQDDIDNAQSDVTSRKTELDDAQTDFNKYSDLATSNPTRKSYEDKLRTAQTNYDLAVQKLEDLTNNRDQVRAALDAALAAEAEAKRTYDNSQNGPDSDRLALAQAQLDDAKAQVAAAQNALDNYDLKAPFDGTVMDINVSVNQLIGPDTWAVAVADTSQWFVDTSDLTEQDVVNVSVGQTVDITADALPGVDMTGVVEEIGLAPQTQSGDVLYTVRIRMDNVPPQLRWGMTMEVTFTAEK
jgi:HlyD family secretion protein